MVGLTALQIKNAPSGMHSDGNGLYLCVKASGTKSWVFRFQLAGKRREMGLGSLFALEPVKARAEAARLKAKVAAGIDPLEERASAKEAEAANRKLMQVEQKRSEMTFRKAAEHYIEGHNPSWKNAKHAQQWTNTLGSKKFLPKHPVKGLFWSAGDISGEVVIAEGMATAAAVRRATGCSVVAAMSAANIPQCAKAFKEAGAIVFVAADNDMAGIKAANNSGCSYYLPPVEGQDFADISDEQIRAVFEADPIPPLSSKAKKGWLISAAEMLANVPAPDLSFMSLLKLKLLKCMRMDGS